jgi:hypothetical protein
VAGPEQAVVKVSTQDLNRIVLPAKIVKVFTSKAIDVKVEGNEAYVKVPPTVASSIELYLLTEQGTYTLMLLPVPVPAETIVIKGKGEPPPARPAEGYLKEIKSLLRDVANGVTPRGYEMTRISNGKEECPVMECSLVAVRRYTGRRLRIDEYLLTNPTEEAHTYDETLFVRPSTRALTLEAYQLEPGGATRLIRVEEGTP